MRHYLIINGESTRQPEAGPFITKEVLPVMNTNSCNMKFRDLLIGDTFDFLNDANPTFNSFYDRCVKTSARTYKSLELNPKYDGRHQVGSINCVVHHCKSRTDATKNVS